MTAVEGTTGEVRAMRSIAPEASQGFESFFETHHRQLFQALWLMTRNVHEAEEVMQDAFVKVWERWDRTSAMENPTGYLYRTAMNVFRSRARRARLAIRRTVGLARWDDSLSEFEEREVVIQALAPLTPRQRAAVVLMEVLDLTSEQAGSALGISPATVRVLAARGRAVLRKAMGEEHA
jgi:RNA polymerase sigma-70 factor (ECF subfamily)